MRNVANVGQFLDNSPPKVYPSLTMAYELFLSHQSQRVTEAELQRLKWSHELLRTYLAKTHQSNVALATIDTVWAMDYHRFLMARRLGFYRTQKRLFILIRVLDLAVKRGYLPKNPLAELK
jgi:hypothetical protein